MPSKRQEKEKNELENEEEEEGENKGFHIDSDMAKFLEHLEQHTRDLFFRAHKKYWTKICLLFITAWQL